MVFANTYATRPFEVQKGNWDAARPYAVVATFRSFNRVIAHYETWKQAQRRATTMNKRYEAEHDATHLMHKTI